MRRINILLMMLVMFLVSVVSAQAGDLLDVQYIAVHFGNAEHMKVLTTADYEQFEFYTAPGKVILYTEDQKLMGNPKNVTGYYGEVPEKMGFSANYKPKKYYGTSHQSGVVYVIDKDGTIGWKSPSSNIEGGYANGIYDVAKQVKKVVKKFRKGKTAKVLKENKRKYLKKTPIGEIEPTKGAKIDKKDQGLVGWPVPDLEIIDESGNKKSLKELAQGKVTVLTFFTMSGVTVVTADKEGKVYEETEQMTPIHPSVIAKKNEAAINQEGGQKAAAKMIGKGFLKGMGGIGAIAGNAMDTDEEKSDAGGAGAYMDSTLMLRLADQSRK